MMCHSKTNSFRDLCRAKRLSPSAVKVGPGGRRHGAGSGQAWRKGFGLAEVVASLVIMGFITSGILVVLNRCMAWASDSSIRMHAFELARENMEKLLSLDRVEEMSESGQSERYPDVTWQTDVGSFYEPVTSRMWIHAVCSTMYKDADGEEQTIELEHWLTNVSKEQLLEILERDKKDQDQLANQVFESIEEAALYAGVDVDTIKEWINNGLVVFPDGSVALPNLAPFIEHDGVPPPEVVDDQYQTPEEVPQDTPDGQEPEPPDDGSAIDPATGLTEAELENMTFEELWQYMLDRKNKQQ